MEFVVHLPDGTPWSDTIFLSGGGSVFGEWRADAVPLRRHSEHEAAAIVDLPHGWYGQFLVTKGNWRSVENDGHGRERPPRELVNDPFGRLDVNVAGWGRDCVHYHHDFYSHHLDNSRTLTVYIPPGYSLETERRFSVLYMHDGQNLFDSHTAFGGRHWAADDAAERVARNHSARPMIVVGIANTHDRLHEYGPLDGGRKRTDRARLYARFLVEEVKPYIDSHYRTSTDAAHTAVAGSSMGGLISLYLAKWYPDVFGQCAALSSSLWWDKEHLLTSLKTSQKWLDRCRFWVDMGTYEGVTNMRRTRRFARILKQRGHLPEHDYIFREIDEGEHNEHSWRQRLPDVLNFLFPYNSSHAG